MSRGAGEAQAEEERKGLKPLTLPRKVTVKDVGSRLTQKEKYKLIKCFHRLQVNEVGPNFFAYFFLVAHTVLFTSS